MKKKVLAAIMAAAIAATALTGCGFGAAGSTGDGDSAAVSASVPTEPFGDTVKYDPSVAINDGKDITVELWE